MSSWDYDNQDTSLCRGKWSPPAVIDPEMQIEASQLIVTLDGLLAPPRTASIREWMAMLGTLTAGNMSDEDAKGKILVYADVLSDFPIGCFTKETLKKAAERVKGYTRLPTYGEVVDVLTAKRSEIEAARRRAMRIAIPAPPKPKDAPWPPPRATDAEKASIASLVAECLSKMGIDPQPEGKNDGHAKA